MSFLPRAFDDLICAAAERTKVHYAFLSGAVRVVVATVAFGMGYSPTLAPSSIMNKSPIHINAQRNIRLSIPHAVHS